MGKQPSKNAPLQKSTSDFLKRLGAVWRWTGNPFQCANWLRHQGVQEEAVMHLANRIALGKIQNPFSMTEIAHIISQNVAERQHAAQAKKKEMPRDKAPELLGAIFKRAGMKE